MGSVVVELLLSCSTACGIFSDQGLNLCPCIGRQILIYCANREVLKVYNLNIEIVLLDEKIEITLIKLCIVRTRSDGTPLQYSCLEIPIDGGAW